MCECIIDVLNGERGCSIRFIDLHWRIIQAHDLNFMHVHIGVFVRKFVETFDQLTPTNAPKQVCHSISHKEIQ
jgi:hypothetical protein